MNETLTLNINEVLNDYEAGVDHKENANVTHDTLSKKDAYIVSNFHKMHGLSIAVGAKEHISGAIQIHDLGNGIDRPYCCGHDLSMLLEKGLGIPGSVQSGKAQHLDTAVSQMIEMIQIMSNEFAGAQAFSSVNTLLAPFVYKDELLYDDVYQNMQQLVYHLNYPSRQSLQCVTEDTEVLTPDGWKSHWEVNEGDDIYTWNDGALNIQKVQRCIAYDFKGFMHLYAGRDMVQQVTDEHHVLHQRNNCNGVFDVTKSCDLIDLKTPLGIPVAMVTDDRPDYDGITDEEIQMSVIVLTDGTIQNKPSGSQCINIFKSPRRYGIDLIEGLLDHFDMSHHVRVVPDGFGNGGSVMKYEVHVGSSRHILGLIDGTKKSLPTWVTKLSRRQAKLFVDTWMKFDGHDERKKLQCDNYDIADSIQHVAFLAGYGTHQFERLVGNCDTPTIYVKCYKRIVKNANVKERVWYEGKVFCPTTDDGIVVYRKEGRVFISGNSPFSNLSFDWTVPDAMKHEVYEWTDEYGNDQSVEYGELQPQLDLISMAFLDVLAEGDRNGKVFTFPIPTYSVESEDMFDMDSIVAESLWDLTAKFGSPYFMNYLGSGINPASRRAMCPLSGDTRVECRSDSGDMQMSTIGFMCEMMHTRGVTYEVRYENEWSRCKPVFVEVTDVRRITLDNGATVDMGVNHLQPTENGDTVHCDELVVGNVLPFDDGASHTIVSIEHICYEEDFLYCLEVDNDDRLFTLANGLVTHNCRLSLDYDDIAEATGGVWNIGSGTGSIAITSINLNRCALEAGDSRIDKYYGILSQRFWTCVDQCLQRKTHVFDAYAKGRLPYAQEYLADGSSDPMDAFRSFFLTVGDVGAYEAWVNLGFTDQELPYATFATETTEFLKTLLKEARDYVHPEFGNWKLWNLEQTPAEGCSPRFAALDMQHYPDAFVQGKGTGDVYLTNSTHLPVNTPVSPLQQAIYRGETDRLYSGGTLFNWYTDEAASPESVCALIKMLCTKTKLPYVAYSPVVGTCQQCGDTVYGCSEGECPECGTEVELMTRVTGYIRATSQFNDGQRQQYENRHYMTEEDMHVR